MADSEPQTGLAAYLRADAPAREQLILTHPSVVQVPDCGKFQDRFILAMEYVDGCSLARLIKGLGRPLPLAAVTFLGAELAAALAALQGEAAPYPQGQRLLAEAVRAVAPLAISEGAARQEPGSSPLPPPPPGEPDPITEPATIRLPPRPG